MHLKIIREKCALRAINDTEYKSEDSRVVEERKASLEMSIQLLNRLFLCRLRHFNIHFLTVFIVIIVVLDI